MGQVGGVGKRFRRLGIVWVLMLSFGVLVFVGVASVLAISFETARVNTFNLLADKADLSISAIETELRRHLDSAREASRYVAAQIDNGDVRIDDAERLAVHLRSAMAAAPQILGMGFVQPDGRWVRTGRAGVPINVAAESRMKDPALLAALRRMQQRPRAFWGPPVYQAEIDTTLVNYRSPVLLDGRFAGMLVAVVSVTQLSRDIAASNEDAEVRAFILYGRDHVLAYSVPADGIFRPSAAEPLPRIDQVGDKVLARLWSAETREPMVIPLEGATQGYAIEVDGVLSPVIYRPLEGYGPEPLYIGAIIPPGAEVTKELTRLWRSATAGVAILFVAAVAAFVIGRQLSRPVGSLAAAARDASDMRFSDVPVLARSRMREIDEASGAFNAMVEGLRWFENYVPRALVRHILADGSADAVRPAAHGITVLFTDIVGFTRLSEHMDAGAVVGLINEHFSVIAPEIDREEGLIDKYIGDSVMAFWGPPRSADDHAARACRAARAIAAVIKEENVRRASRGAAPIRIRVGLHTGPAMVGNIGAPGRVNYTVIGDTVNVAQRLEELGKTLFPDDPGDAVILVSEDVIEAAGTIADAVPCGRHHVRGRESGIGVYRI